MSFWNRKKKEKVEKYKEIPFQHLAPIDTIDDKTIFDALDYALSQNNVHNIALTGNYGSGKSSILESYIKRNRNCLFIEWILRQISKVPFLNRFAKKKKWFLQISLATFAIEYDDGTNSSKEVIPKTTEQEIEKSILQQIFYRKSGKKFPYSHFSRIKKIGIFRKLITELVVLLLLLVPLYIKKGNLLDYIQKQFPSTPDKVDLILVLFCAAAFLVVLYKSISLAYKLRLAKFSFQDAEIEFEGKDNEESLLNKYLDELLYFFEVTEYNVVIFEDLDRFRNTEIFIKLRELNTLLSNYEKINRKIIFVYALRDEVFKDCSRTKFFDFIIPVIPVINNQNSSDILLNLRNENPESPLKELDESFLQDVGLYVDDMRLLINSINEFKIYDKKINEDDYKTKRENTDGRVCRDRNKIFALILYKNLYPNDFALLTQNKGELYSIFQKKNDVAELEIPKIENSIIQLENQIKIIENQVEVDIKELRTIYIAKVFSKKPKNNNAYVINDVSDFLSDENFKKIQLGNTLPCAIIHGGIGNFKYNFFDVENEVNSLYSYEDREAMLKKKVDGELENLKKQLSEKRASISNIQQMSIAEMLDTFPSEQFVTDVKTVKKDFVIYLLRYGYIDENYFDYISYFYANSLSEDEKQYLLLIKNQQNPNFGLLIKKSSFNNVVARIKDNEWKLPAVLNYSVLYYIISFDDSHIDVFLNALWDYKRFNRNSLFLSKFRADPPIQSKLYRRLYDLFSEKKDWFVILFDDEDSIVVYKFFVSVDFKKTESDIIAFLTNDVSFLHRADIDANTVSSKINFYGLKFNLLEDTVKYSIYNIILDNNAYVISKRNFDIIIKNAFAGALEEPIRDYYTRISKLRNPNIRAYVDQNIETFVKNIVLSTGESIAESEDAFIELLNNNTLMAETKVELIEKNGCIISDITKIKSTEIKLADSDEKSVDIRNLLYKHKKVCPTWSNVFEIFKINGKELGDSLVDYLNDEQIVFKLVKEKPLTNNEINSEKGNYDIASEFYSAVLNSKNLTFDSFSELMGKCPWNYKKMDYGIEQEKMSVLIEQKKLVFTQDNYTGIKQNHLGLLSKYIAAYFNEFINKWNELKINVTPEDMKLLLDSNELDKNQKRKLLSENFDIWSTMNQKDSFVWLGKKVIELEYSEQLTTPIAVVIRHLDDEEDLMKIIALQGKNLKNTDVTNTINNKMGEPLKSCIMREGKQKNLPNKVSVRNLCAILQEKGLISSFKEDGDKIRVQQKRPSS